MSPKPQSSKATKADGPSARDEELESSDAGLSEGEESVSHSQDESNASSSAKGKGKAISNSADGSSVPIQKRRRVTRACDECRRKKIKCDGKQPCTHCQVYSYECTYDKPSNRRRNPAPQYIEALETKLQRAESLLRNFMPDVDLNDPNLDPAVQQEFRLRERARARALQVEASSSASSMNDGKILSMISGVGQLDLDEKGDIDYQGLSSGTVFFKRMKEHFRGMLGRDYQIPRLPRPPRPRVVDLEPYQSSRSPLPKSSTSSSIWRTSPNLNVYELPPKEVALTLSSYALDYGTCLMRIVHTPTYYQILDDLYKKAPNKFGKEDTRNLVLMYSVFALGCMYNVPVAGEGDKNPSEMAMEEGMKYYACARILAPDLTDCRDLTSLQALLFMALFIQSISNPSTSYSYVGIALRSALRMGLHRNLPYAKFSMIEVETRRRVFYACRHLDTFVSALLGFPLLLNDEDVDQPLPTPVDDEYITKTEILPTPPGAYSFFEAFNAHVKLTDILSRVIKQIYPLKGIEPSNAEVGQSQEAYMISFAKIKEMEEDLQQWFEELPVAWRPNSDGPDVVVRVRNLLRFAYAHVQMVLYRPFIHYVSPRVNGGNAVDERTYACGAAGISVARNIVHIGTEMRRQEPLVGPYWFTFFTEFFAVISLVFFVLENQDKAGTTEILADAVAGKDMIKSLATRSLAADRISKALVMLFDQLPDKLKSVKATPVPSKKRRAAGSKATKGSSSSSSPYGGRPAFPRVEDLNRPRSGLSNATGSSMRSTRPGASFDPMVQDQNYSSGFSPGQGMSPLDIAATTPETTGSGSHHEQSQGFHQTAGAGLNPLHQLDAMMFPSEDPLAYPNQPGMHFSADGPRGQNPGPDVSQQQDAAQFYVPMYSGMEAPLMGPLPPYLMQEQGQQGLDFSSQMYSDAMLPLSFPQQQGQFRNFPQFNAPPPYVPPPPAAVPAPSSSSSRSGRMSSLEARQRARDFDLEHKQFANTPWTGIFPHYD